MIRSLARSVAPLLPAEARRPGPATRFAGRTLRRLHRLEMKLRGHSAQARYSFSIGILRGPSPFLLRRSEEHTSELQSLMRTSYAVFCLKTKNKNNNTYNII